MPSATSTPASPLFHDVAAADVALATLAAIQGELETLLTSATTSPSIWEACQTPLVATLAPIVKAKLELVISQVTSEAARVHIETCIMPLVDTLSMVGIKMALALINSWTMTYVAPSALQQFIDSNHGTQSSPQKAGTYL